MCLIYLAKNVHPDYKLILVANRDEFYKRPSLPVGFWEPDKKILAGRDIEAGGTWLGINTEGKISAITNYRDLRNKKTFENSRGELPKDFLQHPHSTELYAERLINTREFYNGYNFLFGDAGNLLWYSNVANRFEMIPDGTSVLGNGLLNDPWFKARRVKALLEPEIEKDVISPETILDLMMDRTISDEENLPDTGLPEDMERALSSIFISVEGYGTRCSSFLTIDIANTVVFIERVFNETGTQVSEQKFSFNLTDRK